MLPLVAYVACDGVAIVLIKAANALDLAIVLFPEIIGELLLLNGEIVGQGWCWSLSLSLSTLIIRRAI
jgi:hypothetical protein